MYIAVGVAEAPGIGKREGKWRELRPAQQKLLAALTARQGGDAEMGARLTTVTPNSPS